MKKKNPPPLFPLLAVRPPPLRGGGSVALKVCAAEVVLERGQIVPGKHRKLKMRPNYS